MTDESAVLARIETKLDLLLETSSDHEKRIRWTERAVYLALGAGLMSGAGLGGLVASSIAH